MSEVEFDVQYPAGHSSHERWRRGKLFCPECGESGVWEEQSDGDYYVGPSFACQSCGAVFTYQGPSASGSDRTDAQRIAAIRGLKS